MKINAEDHIGLVKKICLKYYKRHNNNKYLEDSDIYSDGLLGLSEAINNYKPELEYSFSTFAYRCIQNKIIDGIRKKNINKDLYFSNIEVDCENFVDEKSLFDISDKLFAKEILENKEYFLLYEKYINCKTWEDISKEQGVTRQAITKRGINLIKKIKDKFLDKEESNKCP